MLTIRLQRTGTKNRASFRLVLAESYRAAGKQALEVLGHYNPRSKDFAIKDQERLSHWLGKHVAVSPTVYNLLVEKKLVTGKKVKAWQPKKKDAAATSEATANQSSQPAAASAPVVAPAAEAEKPVEAAA
jgi:small subunit ribosomal protein S16